MPAHKHSHCPGHHAPQRVLGWAVLIITSFAIIEVIAGWQAHSLALLSDAGHMASDAIALGIAAFAAWLATSPPSQTHSYGLGRAEIVAAWLSSFSMLLISLFIILEAAERLAHQHTIHSLPMIIIGGLGILVNIAVAALLMRSQRTLNIKAALLHIVGDLLGSIAALFAGIIIHTTHWLQIDPILSIFISLLILVSSIRLLRESILVLMEGVPSHIALAEVKQQIINIDGIQDIHDLHIWTLTSGMLILTAHVHIECLTDWPILLEKLHEELRERYDIHHVTVQPEAKNTACQPCH
jgi:cobalt-zinc-cadmium efflux system protein